MNKLQEGKLYRVAPLDTASADNGHVNKLVAALLSGLVLMYVGPSHKEPDARVLLLHKDGVADVDKEIAKDLEPYSKK